MPRERFRPVELTEALRPVAAPVDSFVQAQVPSRDNNLQDLARSLSGLGGSLAGLVGQRDKQAEEEDAIRGKAAYYQSNQKGFAEGVSSGAIPAQASPAFVRAYKQTEGEVAGGVLEQKFSSAYDQWEGKTNAAPAAFDSFLGGFLKQNIGTNDPDVLRGVLPKVEQLRANYLQRHIGDVSKSTMQGAIDAASAKDSQAIDTANAIGLSSEKGTDYQGVFSQIEANREASLKVGMDRAKYDEKVVDNITALAIKNRDPKLLDFLSRKVPGTDYSWDAAPYGRDQKQKAINTLETMGRRSIADDEEKRREEKADLKDAVTRETIQAITKAPNDPIPEALLARGEKVDPDFRVNAIRWRDTIGKGTQTSDPEDILAVTSDILNGGGLQRVQRAMRDGVFKNASDLTTAWKLAEGMAKDGGKLDAITKLQSFKDLTATIKVRTGGRKDPLAAFDDGSFTAEGLQAMTDLRGQLLQWAQKNPEAGLIDQEEAVAKFGASLLKRVPDRDATDVPFYNREGIETPNAFGAKPSMQMPAEAQGKQPGSAGPQGPGYANRDVQVPSGLQGVSEAASSGAPQATAPGPVQAPPAPSAAPAPAPIPAKPAPQASQPEAVSAWLNALPPEMRSRLEVKAAEERKPLMLKAQEVYERGVASGAITAPAAAAAAPIPAQPSAPAAASGKQTMRAPDGTPIETASASVSGEGPEAEAAARDVTAAFRKVLGGETTRERAAKPASFASPEVGGDPRAVRILDFVAGPESGGNYNAYFGHARSSKDLSAMTFKEVMDWSGNRGTASSATGRYQFMRRTLQGLQREMNIPDGARFTPELQDRMALQLLNRRGYREWSAGKLSTEGFAANLAKEWASLPNFNTGKSHYDGDGLNKAGVSPAQVRAALEGTGAFPSARLASAAGRMVRSVPGAAGFTERVRSMFGGGSASAPAPAAPPAVDVYSNAPKPEVAERLRAMNPNAVANSEAVLSEVTPILAAVLRQARADNPKLPIAVLARSGEGAEVWPVDAQGRVSFDPAQQDAVGAAVRRSASQLGFGVNILGGKGGGRTHIELAPTTRA